MLKWYEKRGKHDDVVLETRVRLARNFNDYKFAGTIESDEALSMVNRVVGRFQMDAPKDYECVYMSDCDKAKKLGMKERQEISSRLAKRKDGAVLLNADESVAIMLNAEDHVRIQSLASGMNIASCFKQANDVDDYIDANFDYAFDEKLGYKTTFPTNVGTGLRASYTLHLPALAQAKRIQSLSTELSRFGMKFKPLFGEENGGNGHIYQIASQRTLGQDEREIIKDLNDIATQVVNQEREQRKHYYEKDRIQIEDEIYKSYGVLKYARKLSLSDAMTLISEIMLGEALGVLSFEDSAKFLPNKILMDIQPAVLRVQAKKEMSVAEADIARAEYMRKNLPEISG